MVLFIPTYVGLLSSDGLYAKRHYGVGADGIIVIRPSDTSAFEMMYYNADGELGSLCGNGSRCALAFAEEIGVIGKDEWVSYTAFGGDYRGRVNSQDDIRIEVPVQQAVVKSLGNNQFFVDTGSPHLIILKKQTKTGYKEPTGIVGTSDLSPRVQCKFLMARILCAPRNVAYCNL